ALWCWKRSNFASPPRKSLLGLFQSFGKRGHDFEDVANDAVIRDFKNRRVRILVNGHDGARALHADDMLNRAADAEREIELWSDRLPRAANLSLHGEPAFIADGTRSSNFRTERFRQLLGLRNILRRFDATPDRNDERGLRKIDGGLGFLEKFERLGADLIGA